jgi:hypothetical protein
MSVVFIGAPHSKVKKKGKDLNFQGPILQNSKVAFRETDFFWRDGLAQLHFFLNPRAHHGAKAKIFLAKINVAHRHRTIVSDRKAAGVHEGPL